MEIKLSNSTATIKEFMNRKLRKEINSVLFKDAVSVGTGEDAVAKLTMADVDLSNDLLVLGMVEFFTLPDGKKITPTKEYIDELSVKDFDDLLNGINSIVNEKKELPKG